MPKTKVKDGKDLKWFSKNFSKRKMSEHSGEWVAIKNKKILSSGKNLKTVVLKAKKIIDEPILVKIPNKEEVLIL